MSKRTEVTPLNNRFFENAQMICDLLLSGSKTILIDGPSGSGKTSLVSEVKNLLPNSFPIQVVSMEDLYEGWSGISSGNQLLLRLLDERVHNKEPQNSEGIAFSPWDWHENRRIVTNTLNPNLPWLVEGCGSVSQATAKFSCNNIWVERSFFVRFCAVRRREKISVVTWLLWERDAHRFAKQQKTHELLDTFV